MPTVGKIQQVPLVAVCLALEAYGTVGLGMIKAALKQPDKVLYDIPEIEEDPEHLFTLRCMYTLMVEVY